MRARSRTRDPPGKTVFSGQKDRAAYFKRKSVGEEWRK
jgi:hypothetical protein